MIGSDIGLAASRNLAFTYFELGSASPGSRVTHEDGYDLCAGPFEHPICNFAANLSIDPWTARRLYSHASGRREFHVYSLPSDKPTHRDELLRTAGFRHSYRLRQMICEPREVLEPIEISKIDDYDTRLRVTQFMVEQFFHRQPQGFRRQVAEATAAATRLDLCLLELRGKPAGAVMVSSVDGMLGIYNLCIAPEHQGRGWGAGIVASVLARAIRESSSVTLQCDPKLEGWYDRLGFRTIGDVEVYGLPKGPMIDII